MAFDFLSYIVDQTQQNTQLFVSRPKEERKYIISHISALQLLHLLKLDQNESYQLIQTQNTQSLLSAQLQQLPSIKLEQYLKDNHQHIQQAYLQISEIILAELHQLNQSAQLGTIGTKELLDGQLPWIQNYADDWIWEITHHTQHKITKTHKKTEADFNQIMKDFNQIIAKTENTDSPATTATTAELPLNSVQTSKTLVFFQPIIALLILYFLYNKIL